MNNPYPTLPPQSIKPYIPMTVPSTQFYNRGPSSDQITLGVPLMPPQMPQLSSKGNPSVHIPPNSEKVYTYAPLPQQQSNTMAPAYYNQNYKVQCTNSNVRDQNGSYIELTDTLMSESPYMSADATKTETMVVNGPTMPGMLYPQLPGPMAPSYSQLQTPNVDQSGPVIYDMSLLYGITSREPQMAHCTHCNKHVQTIVNYKTGKGAVLSGMFMGCMGGVPLLCSWVPCVVRDFKDAIHYCPVCGSILGTKKFLVN